SLCQQSSDQLTQANPLSPGDVLISKDGAFALGFFSAERSSPSPENQSWCCLTPKDASVGRRRTAPQLGALTLLPCYSTRGQVPTRIISWKSPDDPSTGNFSYGIGPNWNLQFFTWYGTLPYSRSNALNDASMSSGMYLSSGASIVYQAIVDTGNRLYYIYTVSEGSPYTRIWLDYTGKMRTQSWNSNTSSWMLVFERPHSSCDLYAQCGPFGFCDSTGDVPTCRCPEGFEPIDGVNYSRGCRRKEALRCGKEDSFVTLPAMKVPDKFLYLRNRSFDQCAAECSRNCSCVAYAYDTLSLGDSNGDTSRCLVWTGDLIDMEKASFHGNLYLRIAGSPVKKKKKSHLTKILLPIIAFVLPLTFTALVWTCKRRGRRQKKKVQKRVMLEYLRSPDEMGDKNIEFPFISFEDIAAATDHFSDSNMLGKGGFGKVYKVS
uniref:Apple domain-containing protein n=1 Tax=Zea mays TaxID=4577 RepID=A0A804U9Z9_MAIZE